MRPFSHYQLILQLDLRWTLTLVYDLWLHEHMKVHILYQETKFGSNRRSTSQMRPFSHFQPILQLDPRWPLTLIYDLSPHQILRTPKLHLRPNVGWNPSKHVDDRAKCWPFSQQTMTTTTTPDNRGQSDPYTSFLLRQVTQKVEVHFLNLTIWRLFSNWTWQWQFCRLKTLNESPSETIKSLTDDWSTKPLSYSLSSCLLVCYTGATQFYAVSLNALISRNLNGGIGSLLTSANAMGRWPYWPSRMEMSYRTFGFGAIIWRDLRTSSLLRGSSRDDLYACVIWIHAGKATHA